MTKYLIFFALTLLLVASVSACVKEGCTDIKAINYDFDARRDDGSCEYYVEEGCTDTNSINYDPEAEKNDGSCLYKGKVVFWLNEATKDSLYNRGYQTDDLFFLLDGELLKDDFGDSTFYFESTPVAPDCPSSSFWSWDFETNPGTVVDLGSNTSKNVTYKIIDASDQEIFSGSKAVQANTCNDVQLKF